ncbi:MAG: peptidoglycan D,D-transpeptidase FtsI family protein, partial [Desulfosudaceae bacterium]
MRYSRTKNEAPPLRRRILFVGFFFSALYLGIAARAVYLQVICHESLAAKASREYARTYLTTGKRGTIFDRNQAEMAVTVDSVSIGVRPGLIQDKSRRAAQLAEALGRDRAEIEHRLNARRSFVWLGRTVSPDQEAAVRKIGLPRKQIEYVPEHKRVYPHRTLAAQVIGFTGIDGGGLEGLEYAFDRYLKGSSISRTVFMDARRRNLEVAETGAGRENCDGNNLVLTLDKTIQCFAEEALARAVSESQAASGMAIVMNPETGAVLAMANYPFFDPTNFSGYDRRVWRNRAVTDAFEPGSTMKIFLAAGSLESGLCTADTVFFCEEGRYRIRGNQIRDSLPHGWLTLHEIVKYSSNIGAVKISERIGKQYLWKILRGFGFNAPTGISCPGSTNGMLAFYEHWTDVDASTIAFGQGVATSAIQLVTAVSAIANGGLLVRPHVVERVVTPEGRTLMEQDTEIVRRVISPHTAAAIADMMEGVTRAGGTGAKAAINGYAVCGKTGTAQKLTQDGKYTDQDYIASFVGFAPKENPQVAVLVVVDA